MYVLLGNNNPAEYVPDEETESGRRLQAMEGVGETITRFGPFPEEGWSLLEKFTAIVSEDGGWRGHSLDDTPEWVSSDNPALAVLLADHWPDAENIDWEEAVARYEEKGGSLA